MKIRVMARERRGGEMPGSFTSFRRAGIDFPSFAAGMVHGQPVEVSVVDSPAFADAFEVDQEGLTAILKEEKLIVEDSPEVRKARQELVDAMPKGEKFVGARVVGKGGFESFMPDPVDVHEAEQDELEKTGKAELMDMAEGMKVPDARTMNKAALIEAIRAAKANG